MRSRTLALLAATALLAVATEKPKIIGGEPAPPGVYPCMAGLKAEFDGVYGHVCGGTLVAEHWVLTAAHCVDTEDMGYPAEDLSVDIGDIDSQNNDHLIRVELGVLHPAYNSTTHNHDLALLKLTKPAPQTPAVLATESLAVGSGATLLGWGLDENMSLPQYLKHLETEKVADRFCDTGNYFDPGTELCVGPIDGKGSACMADSGGPMLLKNTPGNCPEWQLAGVTSRLSNGSCSTNEATIYISVFAHREWIEATIQGEADSTSERTSL